MITAPADEPLPEDSEAARLRQEAARRAELLHDLITPRVYKATGVLHVGSPAATAFQGKLATPPLMKLWSFHPLTCARLTPQCSGSTAAVVLQVSTNELDQFHGHCTPWLRTELQDHVKSVFTVDGWPGFFTSINVPLPSRAAFADWIR